MPTDERTCITPPVPAAPLGVGGAACGGPTDGTNAPGQRWPTAEDVDEAIDLLNAQMRIAVRRAVGGFLLDHERDPLALEVAADAVGGELNRRLRDALLEQCGEQTLAALLAHRQPPVLITAMLSRVRATLRDRLVQLRKDACHQADSRPRLVACH